MIIEDIILSPQDDIQGKEGQNLNSVKNITVGSGSKTLKVDENGLFLGADKFADAPWKVDFDGLNTNTELGDLAALDTVGTGQLDTTVISGGKIITGLLTADNIQAGTLTGRTVQTNGSGSGPNTKLNSALNGIDYIYNNVSRAYTTADSSGNLLTDSDAAIYTIANNQLYFEYNEDGGSDSCVWVEDGGYAMALNSSKDLDVDGDLSANNFDFAELFEATAEFSHAKIPNGTSVSLVGDKIKPAELGEIPIGVISATAGIVLNGGGADAGKSWGNKYLRDEYGAKIYEEVEMWHLKGEEKRIKKINGEKTSGLVSDENVPAGAKIRIKKIQKVNPEFNENKKYKPRKERPEWNIVGLIGRVRLRKGQPVAPNWIKLKNVSDSVEEWLIR